MSHLRTAGVRRLLGGAAAWPLRRARSTEPDTRVGWITLGSPAGRDTDIFSYYDSFRAGLAELGYVDGSNIVLIKRSAEGVSERLPDLIEDILRENVSVLVSPGPAIRTVRERVKSLPVIFAFSGDPVAGGLVDTLARGKGNLTGLSYMAVELNGKRIDLMKELVPTVSRITLLTNPIHPGEQLEVAEFSGLRRPSGSHSTIFRSARLPNSTPRFAPCVNVIRKVLLQSPIT